VSGIGKSGLVFTPGAARIRLSYISYMTSADGSMGRRCFRRQRSRSDATLPEVIPQQSTLGHRLRPTASLLHATVIGIRQRA
jgi:hypothetical protein